MKIIKVPFNASRLIEQAEANRAAVLGGAARIEIELQNIIRFYFMFGHPDIELAHEFQAQVVEASWFTFESKKGLAEKIVEWTGYWDQAWRSSLSSNLRDVIRYRNYFVHGKFEEGGEGVRLSWYSGGPASKILTDEWLTKIEQKLQETTEQVSQAWSILVEIRYQRSSVWRGLPPPELIIGNPKH